MPVSINNTTLTFNDGTTMTSRPVTSVTGAGTVSVSASTGAVTITGTGGTGTVTSVATGNGLQGGTITTSGTLSIACPGFNTVGSYACAKFNNKVGDTSAGTNFSAGTGNNQIENAVWAGDESTYGAGNSLSGTWKWMARGVTNTGGGSIGTWGGMACRVS